jgi:23S rRNA pseudouridine2605 synthase/23S rRNA pseudouridine2604 synthase
LEKELIRQKEKLVYYKMNKPRWIVTTCANHWEKNIVDIIDIPERVFPIWRLDRDTTGLILLTNDGRLANFLMHPRYEHKKEYIVETFWSISDEQLEKMRNWLFILWSYTKKAKIDRISSGRFSITITEWRNRQIRRMVEKVGSKVKKLKRIRIENIVLGNLDFWEYKHLTQKELDGLFKELKIES